MKKGLMIKCLLCCKKGGAMKPTNIFTSKEKLLKFNQGSFKHSSKSHKSHKKMQPSQSFNPTSSTHIESKTEFACREDKSLSLAVILKREIDYQNEICNGEEADHDIYSNLELLFEKSEKES